MTPLRFRPAAARELVEAERRYAMAYPGRAKGFLDAVEQALATIRQAPESYAFEPGAGGARSVKVLRFPYRIVFFLHEGIAFVIAVAHGRRQPGYWRRRRLIP